MSEFIPKGGMCANCKFKGDKCHHLDFRGMRPMYKDRQGATIVICEYFERESNSYE